MAVSRGLLGAGLLGLSALVAGHAVLAQQVAAECRTPLLRSCLQIDDRRGCLLQAMQQLPDACRKALSERSAARAGALPAGWREERYGADPKQVLDLALPAGSGKAPLLLFVHGGGWSIGDKRTGAGVKGAHFLKEGWAFASINYRLVPQASVEQQAADVASAVAWARRQPGIDPDRIVLMGHSAGAHLAALVGTDPFYLKAARVPLGAVRGIVLLDGAGYDIAQQMAAPGNPVAAMYDQAFGRDPARQARLSPTRQAGAPNVADWLILPVAHRTDSVAQSEGLARALRAAGDRAEVAPQDGKTHASLNRELGETGDPATMSVDRFLARLR